MMKLKLINQINALESAKNIDTDIAIGNDKNSYVSELTTAHLVKQDDVGMTVVTDISHDIAISIDHDIAISIDTDIAISIDHDISHGNDIVMMLILILVMEIYSYNKKLQR